MRCNQDSWDPNSERANQDANGHNRGVMNEGREENKRESRMTKGPPDNKNDNKKRLAAPLSVPG